VEGTARPTASPLIALPANTISTEEGMLAKPMIRKDSRKMKPVRRMDSFLPAKLRETDERRLPSIAPSGGSDTEFNILIRHEGKVVTTYPCHCPLLKRCRGQNCRIGHRGAFIHAWDGCCCPGSH